MDSNRNAVDLFDNLGVIGIVAGLGLAAYLAVFDPLPGKVAATGQFYGEVASKAHERLVDDFFSTYDTNLDGVIDRQEYSSRLRR